MHPVGDARSGEACQRFQTLGFPANGTVMGSGFRFRNRYGLGRFLAYSSPAGVTFRPLQPFSRPRLNGCRSTQSCLRSHYITWGDSTYVYDVSIDNMHTELTAPEHSPFEK